MNTLLHVLFTIILNLRNMLFIDTYDHFETDYSSNFWLHSFDFPLPPLDLMNPIDFSELNDILHYVYKSDAIHAIHDVIHQVNPV